MVRNNSIILIIMIITIAIVIILLLYAYNVLIIQYICIKSIESMNK